MGHFRIVNPKIHLAKEYKLKRQRRHTIEKNARAKGVDKVRKREMEEEVFLESLQFSRHRFCLSHE